MENFPILILNTKPHTGILDNIIQDKYQKEIYTKAYIQTVEN